ncbi:tRNA pseudouridine(55) synthase TruB [Virgibacillus xinjiangensis]|uniref:tRNA pseudouridine synthase B n=1 Tax=Virgibacillus xinjiangensis TaxID=393090 RepID=A0ABV7CV19_9BACI
MHGILPLWKPKGMTSHDCVVRIRRLFKTKKVGHTGTLDPEVEGILPICIGQATKIVPFLTDTKKTYIAELKLGWSTETEDDQGEIIERKPVTDFPTEETVDNVLQSFKGEITQIPPMYSAVKVNGRKLYEYARKNLEVERPKRSVTIFEIERISLQEEKIRFKVVCSKGTYIRTLCVNIGEKLGYPAHMSDLCRTQTGSFDEKDGLSFTEIEEAVMNQKEEQLLCPLLRGVDHLDELQVDESIKRKVENGRKLEKPEQPIKTDPFRVMHGRELLAIYQNHPEKNGQIKPVRVFQV